MRRLADYSTHLLEANLETLAVLEKVALLALVLVLSTLLLATGAPAGQSGCDGIASLLINNTTITSTNYVFPAGYLPGYCEVTATVSPETDVAVRLPDNWLGRYLHLGGGGFDGVIPSLDFTIPRTPKNPIEDGFVVVASNGGHRAADYPYASFSADRGLTLGYATGAIYDSDVVGTALVKAYYGEAARYRYFMGCSNGGKNASHAAGTFSDFYDGVISTAGVIPMGPPFIWVPVTIWLFYQNSLGWGIFRAVWGAFVISGIDNIVKPYLISRGVNLPFVLILLGVLGGVIAFGFIGVFLGPTLLALGYSLISEWTSRKEPAG